MRPSLALRVSVLGALVAIAAGCEQGATPVSPSFGSPVAQSASGTIAFVSGRDGNNEIYVMYADGTGVTRLTNDPGSDAWPAWSPDGTRLAFTSTRDGHNNIYVMNADGSGVTQLTTSESTFGNQQPAWCGNRIAFAGDRNIPRFPDIYVMNDDGTGVTRLTTGASFDEFPAWSPTCDKIAFTVDPSYSSSIAVMNADGTGLVTLMNGPGGHDENPAWSPDGTRIAFSSDRESIGNNTDIFVMNADGTAVTRVTEWTDFRTEYHRRENPAWSPDGTQIAFSRWPGSGSPGTYVINVDGTGQVQLADGIPNNPPAWVAGGAPPPPPPENRPPVAAFVSSCRPGACDFTNTSSDPDGPISAYNWAFGDGGTSTLQNPSHVYAAGTYTVTLTVTDGAGATDSTSHSVTVTARNAWPSVVFTSSCRDLTCTFTNSSSDPDGTIASQSWTFGDGGTSADQSPTHTYAAGGFYNVTLMVTDNQGATSGRSDLLVVTAPPPPPPPVHVADLDGSTASDGRTWAATVDVTVRDATQAIISGATVAGRWSLDGSSSSCTTDATGRCRVTLMGLTKRAGNVTFSVTGVTVTGRAYDPAVNADPDGSSDGTSIILTNPRLRLPLM